MNDDLLENERILVVWLFAVAAMLLGVQVDLFNARLSAALIVVVIVSVVCPFIIELLLEALQLYISNNGGLRRFLQIVCTDFKIIFHLLVKYFHYLNVD